MSKLWARAAVRFPGRLVFGAVLLSALSLLHTARKLELRTSRLDILPSKGKYAQLFREYDREFGQLDKIAVVVESDDPDRAKAFATALAGRLQADKAGFEEVFYRIDVDPFKNKSLFYLSHDDLIDLKEKLEKHHELIQDLAASPSLHHLFALINQEMTKTFVSHLFTSFLEEEKNKEPIDLSLLIAVLTQMNERLDGPRPYLSPWETFFTKGKWKASGDGFLWSDEKEKRLLFVLANPKEVAGSFDRFKKAIGKLRKEIADLQKAYPEMRVGVTGTAVLESDEMSTAQRDMSIATVMALVGVALLFVVIFRGVVKPLLAVSVLGIGLSWSLGFTALTVGHLNILSIAFAPMIIGLGIDFGVHFLARYEEERTAGRGIGDALEQTLSGAGRAIVKAALTTAFAFFTLTLAGFKGLVELGLITGSGLLLTMASTLLLFPPLLVLEAMWNRRQVAEGGEGGSAAFPTDGPSFMERAFHRSGAVLMGSAFIILLSLVNLSRVKADFNLLNLQAKGTESVEWEKKIIQSTKRSALFAVVLADSLEEARRKAKALEALPSVSDVEGLPSLIPLDQDRKAKVLKSMAPLFEGIALDGRRPGPIDLEALLTTLEKIKFKMVEEGEEAWDPKKRPPLEEMREVRSLIERFVEKSQARGNKTVLQALSVYQEELLSDLREKLSLLQQNLRAKPVTVEDLPQELKHRYIGRSGRYRLQVFPNQDIWEPEHLRAFVAEVRSVDPDAIGYPVLALEHMKMMTEDYLKAGLYAFAGIAILTFFAFKGFKYALLALVPIVVGAVWTLGVMEVFQLRFNLANLIILPLIVGLGIENGVHIVHRYMEGREKGIPPLPRSMERAILASSLTTMIGFGSLMVSRHQGVYSIGLLLTLGTGCVLLASLTVLPALLRIVPFRDGKRETDGL